VVNRKSIISAAAIVGVILVAVALYIRVTAPPVMRADVLTADDRNFFPVAHELISNAVKSVDVVLYQSRFYFRFPGSTSNVLIADLADAAGRGVKVRSVLELAGWNVENSEGNRDVWILLRDSGADLYFDPIDRTSHTKLVIVDGEYTIVGSSNWSYYSLDRNNEANVVIRSKKVADSFREFFDGMIEESGRRYVAPLDYVSAPEAMESGQRYALIHDLPRSAAYDEDLDEGFIYFDGATVTVSDGELDRLKSLYPEFFEEAPDESLRVLVRIMSNGGVEMAAVNIEKADTARRMFAKLASERSELKAAPLAKPAMEWIRAQRVVPLPNEKYVGEITKLISGANERIWVSMLNAVYYESTPGTARKEKAEGEIPSLTNVIAMRLEDAARRGVDVRVLVDVGRSGAPSWGEDTFLERLGEAGAEVYTDSPETTTHAKLMIVDREYTVIGSTNWTYHAVEENNETSVVIESGDINRHYATYIDRLISGGIPYQP
jgi:phosphatidylserine/phosphatidylglycerophosphate/cardiolipin synthase-like enzyme